MDDLRIVRGTGGRIYLVHNSKVISTFTGPTAEEDAWNEYGQYSIFLQEMAFMQAYPGVL